MNLKQTLEDTAREMPRKEAIVFGAQRITYGELDRASNKVASALGELGMEKGDHVAILMSHSPEWVINYFGVIKGGGVAVLLNPALKAPELNSLLRDSDSEILLTEKEFSPVVSPILAHIPCLRRALEVDGDSYARMLAHSSSTPPGIDIEEDRRAHV